MIHPPTETSPDGTFKRTDAAWRSTISKEPGSTFPPEKDRYHLYVAHACPWAHRTLMARALKGLEDVISITVVMPIWQRTIPDNPNDEHTGWMFADHSTSGNNVVTNSAGLGGPFPSSYPSNEADPIFNARSVRNIYQKVGDKDGKYSVPILFDKKLQTIVSNESSEIIQMLNSQFDDYASCPEVDLEPEDLKEAMASVDSWIYPCLNNGVYRCGFAHTQEAYDTAIDELTAAFDRVEHILSSQRYIAGDRFTLSDIRLFVTLLRFDEVYVVYFKTNTRSVANSSVLLNYCRDIYQMPGVAETVDMHQIKEHYYCSHPDLNKFSIVPRGPDFERMLQAPHNRESFDVKRRRIDDSKSQVAVSDEDKHSLKSDESVDTL
ncbi:hypothetical protein ACHAXM_001862 [Skeletonema potamos]|jgi:putative glutathione S-transferase